MVSSIPDEQVFGRRDKYINDQQILMKVAIVDTFLQKIPHMLKSNKNEIKYT